MEKKVPNYVLQRSRRKTNEYYENGNPEIAEAFTKNVAIYYSVIFITKMEIRKVNLKSRIKKKEIFIERIQ